MRSLVLLSVIGLALGLALADSPVLDAMHRALTGSRMITLDGAFRHGVYLLDPATCVTSAVESYLLEGALPPTDMTCARN